jgi:iron complex transport system substrate-binding protein
MRLAHGWHVAAFAFVLAGAPAAQAAPQRVVSTFLCTDEYVFRLLPRERIAALSYLSADRHPVVSTIADDVAGIPLVHDSAEEVLARHPDAVVMFAGTQARLHAQLRAAGVPIIDANWSQSLAAVRLDALALGRALGVEARTKALLDDMDRTLASARSLSPPVRTLIYEPNGYAGSDPLTDEILHKAGLTNVGSEIGATRSGLVPVEAVVANPPELLLLSNADPRPSLANLVLHHPALRSLAGHTLIAPVSLRPLACPGPWSAAMVPALASLGVKARALAPGAHGP